MPNNHSFATFLFWTGIVLIVGPIAFLCFCRSQVYDWFNDTTGVDASRPGIHLYWAISYLLFFFVGLLMCISSAFVRYSKSKLVEDQRLSSHRFFIIAIVSSVIASPLITLLIDRSAPGLALLQQCFHVSILGENDSLLGNPAFRSAIMYSAFISFPTIIIATVCWMKLHSIPYKDQTK